MLRDCKRVERFRRRDHLRHGFLLDHDFDFSACDW
jgi:hypothetical protein